MMSIEGLWILVTLWPDKVTPLHWKVRCRHPSWAPLSTWIWTSLDACSCKDVSMSFDQIDHLQSTLAAIQSRHLEAFWLGIRSTLGGLCLVMEIESIRVGLSLRVWCWLHIASDFNTFQRHEVATTMSPESLGKMKMATKSGASVVFWSPRPGWFVEHQTRHSWVVLQVGNLFEDVS